MNKDCARAEILAGAIALGEASETERDDYRRHISACSSCLRALGGEREIERVMSTVKDAAQSEVWEPVALRAGERRTRTARRIWSVGLSTALLALVASLGIHTLLAANVSAPVLVAARQAPVARASTPFHVTLEHRTPRHIVAKAAPAPAQPAPLPQQPPKIVVVHNVITLKQTDRPETKAPVHTTETTVADESSAASAPAPQIKHAASNIPVWRRNEALPRANDSAVNVASNDTPTVLNGHAESIAVAPSYAVRDVSPIGGDTAISPRPAPIAYEQGAEGTTAFEVSVDEHGSPVKCTITKTSGYLSLDDAVCKAAMKARYTPRTVNGRATAGIYRDAFTFRALQPQNTDQQPF